MKKIILLLLLLVTSPGILRAAIYDTFEIDGLRYMIVNEGDNYYDFDDYDADPSTVVVTWQVEPNFYLGEPDMPLIQNYYCKSCTENQNYPGMESITIPASVEYNGKSYIVEGIGAYAFHGCTDLKEVIVNNGINRYNPETNEYEGVKEYKLWNGAFIESGLSEITLPKGWYEIGADCFLMSPLEKFACEGRASFNTQAFAGTKLDSVVLDDNRTLLGHSTFVGCDELKVVVLNKDYSLSESSSFKIDASHFRGCYNLEKFSVDENNGSYADIDGVLFNKPHTKLIAFPDSRGGDYTIPDGVKEIGSFGISYSPHLKSITIPESVTAIDNAGISRCDSLQRIITRNPVPITFTLNDAMFIYIDKDNCTLYVPIGTLETYRQAFAWKDFTHIMEFNPEDPGDVNVDGKMNVSDVTALINMILGITTMNDVAGDVNGDGSVNVSDVTALINLILGIK